MPTPVAPDRIGITRGHALQVLGLEAGVLGDAREHAWAKLFAIVEGEHEIGPTLARQSAMRTRLTLDPPSELEKRSEDALGLRRRSLAHAAAATEMLIS